MEISREVELDRALDEVWSLLTDPEELAGWVGDEVRGAAVSFGDDHTLRWTWAPSGVESTVEVTLTQVEERTVVRVVERSAGACTMDIDDALLHLELKALTWQHRLVRT